MEISEKVRIHFIGIGGVSMSALALLMKRAGAEVSGSDKKASETLDRLKDNVKVYVGTDLEMAGKADLVVYTSAVKEDDEELAYAKSRGIPTLDRAEFLGEIASNFGRTVAVAGTHGKTTVTAMIAVVMKGAGFDFVGHVGGETEYGNTVFGGAFENANFAKFVDCAKDGIFLTEACEYKKNLLRLRADIGVILNAECDHPDCYPDLGSVKRTFSKFADVCNSCVLPLSEIALCSYAHMRNFTYEDYDERKTIARVLSNGDMDLFSYDYSGAEKTKICVLKNKKKTAEITLPDLLPSTPMNVLFAFAVCDYLGIQSDDIVEKLREFSGVKRRNEYAGKLNEARVIFDYAHHPSEIRNILTAYPNALVVFQPHTYSRTAKYMDEFVDVLSRTKAIVIMPTYGAREGENKVADSETLVRNILSKNAKSRVYATCSHSSTLELVKTLSPEFDKILLLGAGDIYDLKDLIDYD